jgi:hypothetical protein
VPKEVWKMDSLKLSSSRRDGAGDSHFESATTAAARLGVLVH